MGHSPPLDAVVYQVEDSVDNLAQVVLGWGTNLVLAPDQWFNDLPLGISEIRRIGCSVHEASLPKPQWV